MDDLVALMPFAQQSGVELVSASADEVVCRLAWAPERCTAGGLLHGGALMTLADSAGAVLAFLGLPEGASTATTSSTTHLVRGVRQGTVTATSRVLHRGRTSVVVQTDLTDEDGRLVSQTTQQQAILA